MYIEAVGGDDKERVTGTVVDPVIRSGCFQTFFFCGSLRHALNVYQCVGELFRLTMMSPTHRHHRHLLTGAQGGFYQVVVRNRFGNRALSTPALLTIQSPPSILRAPAVKRRKRRTIEIVEFRSWRVPSKTRISNAQIDHNIEWTLSNGLLAEATQIATSCRERRITDSLIMRWMYQMNRKR